VAIHVWTRPDVKDVLKAKRSNAVMYPASAKQPCPDGIRAPGPHHLFGLNGLGLPQVFQELVRPVLPSAHHRILVGEFTFTKIPCASPQADCGRECATTKFSGGRRLRLPLASLSVFFVSRQDRPANAHRFVCLSHKGFVQSSSICQALQPEAAIILLVPAKPKYRSGPVDQ